MDRFKPDVEYIVSTYRQLRRREGTYVEGGNVGRLPPGWMSMDLIDDKVGIYKSHRELSEV